MLKRVLSLFIITFVLSGVVLAQKTDHAMLLKIDGAIGPATSDYVERGIVKANQEQAEVIILQMDTPGGLDISMRRIIKAIFASSVPVVGYVAPRGARAASAGTFMLYASHIAAMAPGTNIGAASPVSIGGLPTPSSGMKPATHSSDQQTKQSTSNEETMKKKVTSDAVAYIRSLAQLRGRNAEWAEQAVTEAATLTANEALTKNVIDIVADDVSGLLKQLNGRTVTVQGEKRVLQTENLPVEVLTPDWRTKFLAVITDPSVAYILLLIGVYGLFFEFANPGFVVPGVAGAIAILLAMYAFQLLPISYAGLGLIILGILFMVAEAFVPSFGALGLGGVIAFIVGSILLLDTNVPGYSIAWPSIVSMAIVSAGFIFMIMGMAIQARQRRIISGREALLNSIGEIVEDFEDTGHVRIHGEHWQVRSKQPLYKGMQVRVTDIDGLTLHVEPIQEEEEE